MRYISWSRRALTVQVVTFIAGLLAAVVIRALFGSLIPLSNGVLLILVIIFVVFAVAVVVNTRQDIITNLLPQSGLVVHTFHIKKEDEGSRYLYDPVISKIRQAQSSLRVVGLYRPASMQSSSSRRKYYDAIRELLAYHHRIRSSFRYERILQVKDIMPGKIDNTQVDELTFKHCQYVLGLDSQKTSLNIQLQQIPNILGSLSFLLIDDKQIVFAIPTPEQGKDGSPMAFQLGTVVSFTDSEGSLFREML